MSANEEPFWFVQKLPRLEVAYNLERLELSEGCLAWILVGSVLSAPGLVYVNDGWIPDQWPIVDAHDLHFGQRQKALGRSWGTTPKGLPSSCTEDGIRKMQAVKTW